MMTEEELTKRLNEVSAMIEETTQLFRQSIRAYLSGVAGQIRAAAKKVENGKINAEGQKDLTAISEGLIAVRNMIQRHKVILERALKVVVHKNQVKAYARLSVALDRLREESERYQKKLRQIANAK